MPADPRHRRRAPLALLLPAVIAAGLVANPAWAQPGPNAWSDAVRRGTGLPAPQPEHNAWPHVERASKLLQAGLDSLRLPGPDGTPTRPIVRTTEFILPASDEASAQLQSFIESSVRTLEATEIPAAIDDAVKAAHCEQSSSDGWAAAITRSMSVVGPDAALLDLANFEIIRFTIASRAGDAPAAEARLHSAARLAWCYEQGPLARRLIGSVVLDSLALALREEIMARRVAPDRAARYLKVLSDARPPTPWRLATNLERVQLEGLAWGIARQSGQMAEGFFARAIEACALEEHPDVAEIVGRATRAENIDPTVRLVNAALDTYAPMSRAQRRAARGFIDLRSVGDLLPCDPYLVARSLTESWQWVEAWLEQIDAHESRFQATRVMLALEAARAKPDAPYPDTLSTLVPSFLSALPVDPVSGAPFAYKKMDDPTRDAFRRGYLLWSLGSDADDDSGREPVTLADLPRLLVHGLADPADGDWVVNTPNRP
ncbi:MAG: hypothetical protein ACKVZJ_08215 [Phycisphaerales bacterium]